MTLTEIVSALNVLSRKSATSKSALMFVLTLVSSVSLCLHRDIDGAQWVSLMEFALPAFLAAESARRWSPKADKEPPT